MFVSFFVRPLFVFALLLPVASCRQAQPSLSLPDPDSLELTGQTGRTVTGQFLLTNTGALDLRYELSSEESWLILNSRAGTLAAGATASLRVSAACPDEPTELRGAVDVLTDATDVHTELEVTVRCEGVPVLVMAQSVLMAGQTDETVAGTLELRNDGNAALLYALASTEPWLEIPEGQSGIIAPGSSASVRLAGSCASASTVREARLLLEHNDPGNQDAAADVILTCAYQTQPGFNVDVRYSGEAMTPERRAVVEAAVARWSELISDDVPDTQLDKKAGQCGNDEVFSEVVDDLRLLVSIGPLQSEGEALAQVNPCFVRASEPRVPVYGTIVFDEESVAELEAGGNFGAVVQHMIGHVLGIGNLWLRPDLTGQELISFETSSSSETCASASSFAELPSYQGAAGLEAYAALGGEGALLIEDEHGPGTQCSHWDELNFGSELMTGFINESGDNPLSRLTVAALADLGYATEPEAADSYGLPDCAPECQNLSTVTHDAQGAALRDELLPPLAALNVAGEWVAPPAPPTDR